MPGYRRRSCIKSSGEHCRPLKKLKPSHEEDDRAMQIKSTNQERNLMVKEAKSNSVYGKKLKSSGQNCPPCKKPKLEEVKSNSDDPQLCVTYASDIWEYLHSLEEEAKSKALRFHSVETDWDMRTTVVEWLVQVADRHQFTFGTLSLSVSYLDRFLSKTDSISRDKFHLLAVCCLLLASKYEDIRTTQPLVIEICSLTNYSYTVQEVVEMEAEILKSLNFEMGSPTLSTFLERFTPVAQETSPEFEFLAGYFAELSLLCFGCTRYLPSTVAASVIFLSKFALQPKIQQPWSVALEQCTGYRALEIKQCVLLIHNFHCKRSGCFMDRVRKKYQLPDFNYVAAWTSHSEIPTFYF